MMRITFINRFYAPDQSATAQLLTDLAQHLASDGAQVQIITSKLDYANGHTDWPRFEQRLGVTVRRIRTTSFGRSVLKLRALDYLSFYFSAILAVLRFVRSGDTVVVKTDPPLLAVVLAPLLALKRAKLVNWLQDLYPEVAQRLGVRLPRRAYAALTGMRNWTLKRAALNAVLGERMREQIKDTGSHVEILPNWSLQANVDSPRETHAFRAALGLSSAFVVGYSGNLGRAHDFQSIFASALRLKQQPAIQFLVIGGGAGKAELERLAAREDLPNLHFLPYQALEQLGTSLRAIDLHWVSLNPAMEGLIVPSKLYGILGAGRAALNLGDGDGEIARILRRHEAGWTLKADDIDGVVNLIESKARDPEALRQAGSNALSAHRSIYARELALKRWSDALKRVAQAP